MGQLSDIALLEKNPGYRDVIRSATMAICYEAEQTVERDTGQLDPETRARYLGMIQTLTSEVQGSQPEAYISRVRWYVARDAVIHPTFGIVKNGTVDVTKLENDEVFLTAVRAAFARAVKLG